MSRTDLDPATIARSLRRMAGDGSIEWVMEPIQASVLLDVADMLDENAKLRDELDAAKHDLSLFSERIVELGAENAKLRELARIIMHQCNDGNPRCDECIGWNDGECVALLRMRELGVEVPS